MSLKTILICIADILILTLLIQIIFKSFKNFWKSIYYLFVPNFFSILRKDYDNDFNYTHKFLLFIFIAIIISIGEFWIFY
jgi:hypothetical protein